MFNANNNSLNLLNLERIKKTNTNGVFLFTNARDEPNIAEWVAHHILLGFDKVYVFDHLSNPPIASKLTTRFDGKLIIQPVTGSGSIKVDLMRRAVEIAKENRASWMLYLDADEFLCLNKFTNNVKQFLGHFRAADAIGVNWLMFGTSGHVNQPKGLITENFIKSDIRLNQHVKSFVRPHCVKQVTNPHFFVISNPLRYFAGTGTHMPMGPFNKQPLPFVNTNAYIAHYYTQSEKEHRRRKSRVLDDGSVNKEKDMIHIVHTIYSETVNEQLRIKYANRTKAFLKNYGIEL